MQSVNQTYKFNCTGCGACCSRIKKVADLVIDIEELRFPYAISEAGKCEKLDENNRCSVYDERPLICNIDRMSEYMNIPIDVFYEMNKKACNEMIIEDGLDEKYLVKD